MVKSVISPAVSAEWKWNNEFCIQVISKGAYVDYPGDGRMFIVETTVIRLNYIALNEWNSSECLNCRDCYETDEEWNAHKAEYAQKREAVRAQIIDSLGINANKGGIYITPSQAEVFTVVHIWEIH
mgnify:CR=1 FL=1